MDSSDFLRAVARAPDIAVSPLGTCIGGRFELLERLGEGGYGVVYRARDARGGALVALKTLRWTDPERIYRFKREFRSLADLSHPNLVALHELLAENDRWFLSMELLEGARDWVSWVRPGGSLDERRLREALPQLAAGLAALHRAGKLHRDVKPSNVLVTPEGRVVLLDFGLVTEAEDGKGGSRSADLGLAGTPAYLAPEMLEGAPATTASDWYAVGVTLHQSLTGALPFAGDLLDVLAAKRRSDPPRPSAIASAVPPDLDELCASLMSRDSSARADARAIVSAVRPAGAIREEPVLANEPVFVGRAGELAMLRKAFEASRRGPVVLRVSGPSGIGKTSLVHRFLAEVRRLNAVVLTGRCYERESVPYKALDGVVDALSRYLNKMGPGADALLPRGAGALERLFPVLGRCDALHRAPRSTAGMDAHEIRRRGISALKELLARIGDRGSLVLWIDDAQWSDADGVALLSDLLSPPDPPAMLVIVSHRDSGATLLAGSDGIDLPPLPPPEAEELAAAMTGSRERARRIAQEAEGNPFFMGELARWASRPDSGAISLSDVVAARVASLPPAPRALLETIAVAGGPIEKDIALYAAGCGLDAVAELRNAHLVRSSGPTESEVFETYHDRIRGAVTASLAPERLRECHAALARELEASGRVSPERLAEHRFRMGDAAAAARWSRVAGDRAAEAFAFERASSFYRRAIELDPAAADWRLHAAFARALSNAARNGEAAEAFLHAAASAPPEERMELRRAAGESFLMNADPERGLETSLDAYRELGLWIPRTQSMALASVAAGRVLLRLRGLRHRRRPVDAVPEPLKKRIDACHTLSVGFSQFDLVRGADFQSRSARMALAAGDEFRIGRALAFEAMYAGADGNPENPWTRRLLVAGREIAERSGDPLLRALSVLSHGFVEWWAARFRSSAEKLDEAAALLDPDRLPAAVAARYERTMARVFAAQSHMMIGHLDEASRRTRPLRDDAIARGDLHARVRLLLIGHMQLLFDDRPGDAHQELAEVLSWMKGSWRPLQVVHFQYCNASVRTDLYEGKGLQAWKRYEGLPRMERELVTRPPHLLSWGLYYRGQAALGAARDLSRGQPSYARELRAHAERDADLLLRKGFPFGVAFAHLLHAQAQHLKGDHERSIETLRLAIRLFEDLENRLVLPCLRHRLGELVGGTEGETLRAEVKRWMVGQGIRNPERLAACFSPGFGAY